MAVIESRHRLASLLVRCEDRANSLADLKGKSIALPQRSREHCYMFLNKRCSKPERFFSQITTPPNSEEALDDVVDGDVQAAVIDGVALNCFKRRKPVRFARLKVLDKSEVFPAGVAAYHPS